MHEDIYAWIKWSQAFRQYFEMHIFEKCYSSFESNITDFFSLKSNL